ncbi:transglycosylase SLT domain-containing protein [Cytobacillus sp. Hm23]
MDSYFMKKFHLKKKFKSIFLKKSKSNGLKYELVLSVIKKQSNFDTLAVSYNGSSVGLMQINRNNTLEWLVGKAGIENVDPFNSY